MCPTFRSPASRGYVVILAHYLAGSRIQGVESPNDGEESVRFDLIGLGSRRGTRTGPVVEATGVNTRRIPAVLTAAGVLLVAGCSSAATLAPASIQEQIATGLAAQVGGTFAVACPGEIPAEKGYTFTCTADDKVGGQTVTVTVTESDDAGTFTWQVSSVAPAP